MKGKINLQFGPSDEGEVGNPGRWFHFYAFCLVALSVAPASWGFLGIYKKNPGFLFSAVRFIESACSDR